MLAISVFCGKRLTGCMSRVPERKTILKILSISLLLLIAGGGVFFVLAPYQASRIRADLTNRYYSRADAPLVLATAAEGGAYYALGNHLRLQLDASQSYRMDVRATRGSIENLALLQDGTADLALIQGGLVAERGDISGDWASFLGNTDKLVALANLGKEYVHVVVPADSRIQTFRDLAGKRLGVGPSGGGADALAQKMMRFFSFGEPTELIPDHNSDLAEAFLDGDIDAAFTVYGLFSPAMEKLLSTGWYRLIPIPEAQAVSRYLPGSYAEVFPPYLYGPDRSFPAPADGPFETLAVNTLLVCQSDLPERQVYTVLEEIFSGPFLKLARLNDLDEERAQSAVNLPLHLAAAAFYNRRNPISSDRFEILSFFLAGVVCLASVIHYVSGRRRVSIQSHRREAIRPYFEAMMDFGDSVETATSPSNLTCLIHKIMATQRGAERKWLEGEFDTEDMENLYAVYSLRCNNAFNKIFDLHFQAMRGVNIPQAAIEAPDRDDEWVPPAPVRREPALPEPVWRSRPAVDTPPPWEEASDDAIDSTTTARTFRTSMADDEFFSGAPLAGIDRTKKEVAQTLPSRYDSGLLYDTEASGAGAVRVRTSKPAAELQATVNKDVPDVVVEPVRAPKAEPQATVNKDVPDLIRKTDYDQDTESGAPEPVLRELPEGGRRPAVPGRRRADKADDQPDQMLLF